MGDKGTGGILGVDDGEQKGVDNGGGQVAGIFGGQEARKGNLEHCSDGVGGHDGGGEFGVDAKSRE